jgi:transketolase
MGSGITLYECLKAHEKLKQFNIDSAVIDLYCIKPLNFKKLIEFVREHGNKLIVVEDHYQAGGVGEMISHELLNSKIRIKTLHVDKIPHSGSPEELMDKYGINARHIFMHARTFI